MTEICKHCNGWRGLHKWDTMQCPYMGEENENWQETTYEEADTTQAARIAELEAALAKMVELFHPGKYQFEEAEALERARALLEKSNG